MKVGVGEYVRTERNFPPRSVVRFAVAPEYELSDGDFFDLARTEEAKKPSKSQLAIEALKASLLEEAARVTRGNEVRSKLFSERINELMLKYTNKQLTAAEVIARLIEMAQEVSLETDRGKQFSPPLGTDELAFFDVVAQNPSAMDVMGDDVLAQIARELVATMQRDIRTDWTVRDDVKAKLRSSIKRLLRKYKYPPDQQKDAIVNVMSQMESLAPRYAAELESENGATQ